MSNINDGGPAFPAYEWHAVPGQMLAVGGMTLRDYFAAKAMQAAYANIVEISEEASNRDIAVDYALATVAYEIADAMLKARGQ